MCRGVKSMLSFFKRLFDRFISWIRNIIGINLLRQEIVNLNDNVSNLATLSQSMQKSLKNYHKDSQTDLKSVENNLKSIIDGQSNAIFAEIQNNYSELSVFRADIVKQVGELEKRISALQKELKKFQSHSENIEEYSRLILLNHILEQAETVINSNRK